MSFFQNIKLENFRNFNYFEKNFVPGCNILIGKNGCGKTNILESISLFEKGKGIRKENLKNFIHYGKNIKNFKISSTFFTKNQTINLSVYNQYSETRLIKKFQVNNNSSQDSIKYFENLFSLIYFLPEMERLFLNNPSVRRNFFDRLIFSVDKNYNKLFNEYKKNIYERYKILKSNNYDSNWIKVLENKIVNLGLEIYKKRSEHINILNSHLIRLKSYNNNLYKILLKIEDEFFDTNYENINDIYDKFLDRIKQNREIDAIVGGCKVGPHKSDITGYNIEKSFNIKQYSTGQQKTIVLLIIIAHCEYLIKEVQRSPIILFDEVCSHLDNENREMLLNMIEVLNVQMFLTGTDKKFFSFLSTKATYCNIT